MRELLAIVVRALLSALSSRWELVLENVALRQQLAVFQRAARKPRLNTTATLPDLSIF